MYFPRGNYLSSSLKALFHSPLTIFTLPLLTCAAKLNALVSFDPVTGSAFTWNKVRVLQRLLTHSFSARCLAVKRVTTDQGKKTPGVDGIIWDTPEKKATAVDELKARGYRPQPLKRVYIHKSDGRRRGLSIPSAKTTKYLCGHSTCC